MNAREFAEKIFDDYCESEFTDEKGIRFKADLESLIRDALKNVRAAAFEEVAKILTAFPCECEITLDQDGLEHIIQENKTLIRSRAKDTK